MKKVPFLCCTYINVARPFILFMLKNNGLPALFVFWFVIIINHFVFYCAAKIIIIHNKAK